MRQFDQTVRLSAHRGDDHHDIGADNDDRIHSDDNDDNNEHNDDDIGSKSHNGITMKKVRVRILLFF